MLLVLYAHPCVVSTLELVLFRFFLRQVSIGWPSYCECTRRLVDLSFALIRFASTSSVRTFKMIESSDTLSWICIPQFESWACLTRFGRQQRFVSAWSLYTLDLLFSNSVCYCSCTNLNILLLYRKNIRKSNFLSLPSLGRVVLLYETLTF